MRACCLNSSSRLPARRKWSRNVSTIASESTRRLWTKNPEATRRKPLAIPETQYGTDNSHILFLMRPINCGRYNYVSKHSVVGIATENIGMKIGAVSIKLALRGAYMMYGFLLGHKETRV